MGDETKAYFQGRDTVLAWWYPESPKEPLYEHYLEQLRWVISQFDWRGKRVADVGTGKGRFAISFALQGAEVYALDISSDMLHWAEQDADKAGAKVRFLRGDAENLPYPDHFFDLVICMETIMHVPHPQKLVQELARVVKPGGQVLVSMTNKYRLNALGRLPESLLLRLLSLARPVQTPRYMWAYSVPTFRRFFDRAGLQIIKLHGQGLFQANARWRLTRRLSLPMYPRGLALWFFARVEPRLREMVWLNVMGTVMAITTPKDS
jgi:ubiquinone biosynthesis O-methyltransferase